VNVNRARRIIRCAIILRVLVATMLENSAAVGLTSSRVTIPSPVKREKNHPLYHTSNAAEDLRSIPPERSRNSNMQFYIHTKIHLMTEHPTVYFQVKFQLVAQPQNATR